MATNIHNIGNVSPAADLSSFRVEGNQLQKLNFFQGIAQKISDCFKNFSAAGKFEIASRNAHVAVHINALASQAMDHALASHAVGNTTLHSINASNIQTLNALKEQVHNAPFQGERKAALLQHLNTLGADIHQNNPPDLALKHSKALRALENLVFTPVNHAQSHNYAEILANTITDNYKAVENQDDIFQACARGMYDKGIFHLGQHGIMLEHGGIDAEAQSGSEAMNRKGVALQLRNDYMNTLPAHEQGRPIGIESPGDIAIQATYVRGLVNDALLAARESDAPLYATIINPDTLANFVSEALPNSTGLWNVAQLHDADIVAVPQNIHVTHRHSELRQHIHVTGDIAFKGASDQDQPVLVIKHFSAELSIRSEGTLPKDSIHPGTGAPQDGQTLFMPELHVSSMTIEDDGMMN